MFSLAVKSHWKMAFRMFKKAIKVTMQDIVQVFKARIYRYKIINSLCLRRRFYDLLEGKDGKRDN